MGININIKKNTELIWTKVFVKYLNHKYFTDYEVVPEFTEYSAVDMHLVSRLKQFPHLDLQLTYAIENSFIAYEGVSQDYSRRPTLEAIDRKFNKFTEQQIDMKNIVLIIQGYMNKKTADQAFANADMKKYAHYPFQGIYYVSPPMVSGDTNESLQSGYVHEIKPIKDLQLIV